VVDITEQGRTGLKIMLGPVPTILLASRGRQLRRGLVPRGPPLPDHFWASYYLPEFWKHNLGPGLSLGYTVLGADPIWGRQRLCGLVLRDAQGAFLALADVADFLVIVFREPMVALFLVLPIPLFSGNMAVMYRVLW